MTDRSKSLRPIFLLCAGLFVLRLVYLIWLSPYDLIEDEAQYWLWAKHLSWSYYSKGPGIAWAIAAITALFGDGTAVIRLVPLVSMSLAMIGVGGLARDIAVDAGHPHPARAGLWSGSVFAISPFFFGAASLATIDAPLIACWALGAWAAYRALQRGSAWAWIVLGVVVGCGFLFKYTMLLFVPGLLLHGWLMRTRLRLAHRWKAWALMGSVIGCAAIVPVAIWNAEHDFVTVRHLLGHLGVAGGDMMQPSTADAKTWTFWKLLPTNSIVLVLMQIGMVGPILIVAGYSAARIMRTYRKKYDIQDHAERASGLLRGMLLVNLSAPITAFYLIVAWITQPEANWPIAASVTLVPLGVLTYLGVIPRARPGKTEPNPPRRIMRLQIVLSLLAVVLMARLDVVFDAANHIRVALAGPGQRELVPGRLIGGKVMGEHVTRLLLDIQSRTGRRPIVICQHYGTASLMAYYVDWDQLEPETDPAHVDRRVFVAAPFTGGRMSHFDFMPEHDLRRADLLGAPAVLLSNNSEPMQAFWNSIFEHVELYEDPLTGSNQADGEHKRDRVLYFGYGYLGMTPRRQPSLSR